MYPFFSFPFVDRKKVTQNDTSQLPNGVIVTSEKDAEAISLDIEAKHFLTKELLKALHKFLEDRIEKAIHSTLVKGVPAAFQVVSDALRDLDDAFSHPMPPLQQPLFAQPNALNLTNNAIFTFLETLQNALGPSGLNFIIQRLANNGTLAVAADPNSIPLDLGTIGSLNLWLGSTSLAGLDTVDAFRLGFVSGPHTVKSAFSLQSVQAETSFNFLLTLNSSLDWIHENAGPLTEAVAIDVVINGTGFHMNNVLAMDGAIVSQLQGKQLRDPSCLEGVVWNETSVSRVHVEAMLAYFHAHDVVAPLDRAVAAVFNNFFALFDSQYPGFAPRLVAWLADTRAQQMLNQALGRVLARSSSASNSSQGNCALYQEDRDGIWAPYDVSWESLVIFIGGGAAVALILTFVVLVAQCRASHREKKHPSSSFSDDGGSNPSDGITRSNSFSSPILVPIHPLRGGREAAPAFDRQFSLVLRLVPLWCLTVSLGIFVLTYTATTGWNYLQLTWSNGSNIHFPPQFIYTIPHLVQLFWDSGAKLNAITLVTLSIAWCNIRVVLLLILWFLPPSKISTLRRRQIINILDYFGKWSVFFFMQALLLPIAFELELALSSDARLNLYTVGASAFFLNLLAGILSLLAGNLMMYQQRCVQEAEAQPVIATTGPAVVKREEQRWIPLCVRVFSFRGSPVRLNTVTVLLLATLFVGSIVLWGFSLFVYNMRYSIKGVAGYVLPALGGQAYHDRNMWWGVFSYQDLMPAFTWSVLFGQVVVGTCTILVPGLLLALSLIAFVVPLPFSAFSKVISILKVWIVIFYFYFYLLRLKSNPPPSPRL